MHFGACRVMTSEVRADSFLMKSDGKPEMHILEENTVLTTIITIDTILTIIIISNTNSTIMIAISTLSLPFLSRIMAC